MRLILIGYRGTGKTTVARRVAELLELECFDADVELERLAGKSIKQIFADDGEQAFRDLEVQVIGDLVQRPDAVLSLGGGAIMREETRLAIAPGTVIWLTAKPETIHARMISDTKTSEQRPNLTTSGGLAEITLLLTQREPVYRACADVIVETDAKSAEQVAQEIVCLVK
ncbi:MAG: shikimate kinase [Planctomycetaceae bacterium]|nr:shikimate kinase [Planctomycetales bacterium]MCB9938772.1 shikimate kinase [Planctomycetaceae bacterium]